MLLPMMFKSGSSIPWADWCPPDFERSFRVRRCFVGLGVNAYCKPEWFHEFVSRSPMASYISFKLLTDDIVLSFLDRLDFEILWVFLSECVLPVLNSSSSIVKWRVLSSLCSLMKPFEISDVLRITRWIGSTFIPRSWKS